MREREVHFIRPAATFLNHTTSVIDSRIAIALTPPGQGFEDKYGG